MSTTSLHPLPTGRITFLMTDVVGSVPLWERDAESMHDALVLHDRLMDEVVSAHGGHLIRSRGEGDSTFSVFVAPTGAGRAAVAALRAIATAPWPTTTPIVVRMAIHTGDAIGREGDYYGSTVNRAARLRGIAVGGQCLVSAATAEAIGSALPDGCRLVVLGTRQLRGLREPETIYELETDARHPALGVAVDAESAIPQMPLAERLAAELGSPFVGRGPEREVLDALAREATAGSLRCGLVGGEPGIGKTTLVARTVADLHRGGATVLYGRCLEDSGLPYGPWVEALDRLVGEVGDALLLALAPATVAELARIVPGVAERRPDSVGAPVDPETQRYLLFAAVARALGVLASTRFLVVVLDDLHWADEPTLQLLHHVVARVDARVLIVATFRDQEVEAGSALEGLLADLGRDARIRRLNLEGLDATMLRSLVEASAGHQLDADAVAFSAALHRETRGNPYFATEVLRHLVESGALRRGDDGRWTTTFADITAQIPDSVRELVGRRMQRLDPTVRTALTTAAVIGTTFDLEVLAGALDMTVDTLLDALEDAERSGLVAATDYDRFEFGHALVAHTLSQELSAPRRARIHRRVAEAMEALGIPDARAGEAALHWARAMPPAPERAAELALQAGDFALAGRAPADAVQWFDHALQWTAEAGQPTPPVLLVRRGTALRRAGDPSAHEALLEAARAALATHDRDSLVVAAIENNRRFAAAVGRVDDARVAVLEQTLDVVGTADSPERARLLATLATELEYDGGVRRFALADQAVAVARRAGDPATLANVLTSYSSAVRDADTVELRRTATEEALALADLVGDPTAAFWAATQLGMASIESVHVSEFYACMDRKAAIAAELEDPILHWLVSWQTCYRHLLEGDHAGAEAAAEAGYAIGEASGQPDAFLQYGAQVLSIRAQQGRRVELLAATEAAVAAAPGIHGFRAALAIGYVEAGRIDEARALVDAAAADGFILPRYGLRLVSLVLWAQAAALLEHPASALLLEALAPYPRLVAFSGSAILTSTACSLGALCRVVGDYERAEEHLTVAMGVAEAFASPFLIAEAETQWCQLLAARDAPGDTVAGRAHGARALDLADRFGFGGIRRSVERVLG